MFDLSSFKTLPCITLSNIKSLDCGSNGAVSVGIEMLIESLSRVSSGRNGIKYCNWLLVLCKIS